MYNEKKSERRLNTFIQVSKNITSNGSLKELIEEIIAEVIEATEKADAGFLLLWDEKEQMLRIEAAVNFKEEMYLQNTLLPGEGISGKVFAEGKSMLIHTEKEIERAMANMRNKTMEYFLNSTIYAMMPVSCISVPLTHLDQKIGVLTIDNFRNEGFFNEEDVSFLEAIGHQIAISIVNARAYYEKEDRANQLEMILSYHNQMNAAVLKGGGSQALVDCLARIVVGKILYFDPLFRFEFASDQTDGDVLLLETWFHKQERNGIASGELHPIMIEGHLYGYLLSIESSFGTVGYLAVETDGQELDKVKELVIKHAVSIIAMEQVKFQEEAKHAREEKGALLAELLNQNLTVDVQRTLLKFGMPSVARYCFLAVSDEKMDMEDVYQWKALEDRVKRLFGPKYHVLTFPYGKDIYFLLGMEQKWADPLTSIRELAERLLLAYPSLSFGVGRVVGTIQHVAISFKDAKYAIREGQPLTTFKDIGLKRYLFDMGKEEADYFVREMIGGILEGEGDKSDLLETMLTYFQCHKNVGKTAARMHLHPNTVYYRLQQLQEKLSCDFDDIEDTMNLQAALFLYERKNSIH